MRSHWIRRGLLGGYLLLTAFILAHSVNAFVEYSLEARRSESAQPAFLPAQSSAEVTNTDPTVLMQSVLTSRLFPIPVEAVPVMGVIGAASQARSPTGPPLDVAKKFVLHGTAVSPDGFAILEDLSSKQQALYRLNDTVASIGTIVQIEKDRILFKHTDQEEWLNIAIETLRPGFRSDVAASLEPVPLQTAPAKTMQASFGRRKRIDRKVLVDADRDSARLFIHGQPSPFLVDGRVQGIHLDGVNFFGFYGTLGLLTGDVVKRVNGLELHDPTRLPSIVHLLRNERTFTLDILRNNAPLSFTYDVVETSSSTPGVIN
jgi:general secretion pathway protein C